MTPEAELRSNGALLVVGFKGATVSRVVLLDRALEGALVEIVGERAGQSLAWTELRPLLEARGLDVEAAIRRSRARG